jgi:hypothetical protein
MNVEPAPVRVTDTVGLTVAVDVEIEVASEVEMEVDVTVLVPPVSVDVEMLDWVDMETDVLVRVDVTVEVFAVPEDITAYAPPATTRATTITMPATAAVPMPCLLLNFIFTMATLRTRYMARRIIILLNIVHYV